MAQCKFSSHRGGEMRRANSFTSSFHTICDISGVSPTDVDQLIQPQAPPWETLHYRIITTWLPQGKKTPEEEARQRFRYLQDAMRGSHHIYTDGSKSETHVATWVWAHNNSAQYRLPEHVSVFTAELFAMLKALDMAALSPQQRVVIFIDWMSALEAIRKGKTTTNEIQGKIINNIHHFPKQVMLVWVLGHCGIHGNEQADRLARTASNLQQITPLPRDLKSSLENGKLTLFRKWQTQWHGLDILKKYKPKVEDWHTCYRPNRREEVTLARLRTNATRPTHMDAYIAKSFPPQCLTCQKRLTISHILLSCRKYTQNRRLLTDLATSNNINFDTYDLLQDNEEIIQWVLDFLSSTEVLNMI